MQNFPKKNFLSRISPKLKLVILSVTLILVLVAIKVVLIFQGIAQGKKFAPPPDTVNTFIVKEIDWQPKIDLIGSITAVQGTSLFAEQSGKVVSINFESGKAVRAGDVLIQIDTSTEEAELQIALATLEVKNNNLKRAVILSKNDAISKASYDQRQAEAKSAEAEVARLRSIINKKVIIAPFSGTTGIRKVNLGEFVSSGDEIVPLFTEDQVYLNFDVPQQYTQELHISQKINFEVDTFVGQKFEASLTAINPQIDPNTRSIGVQSLVNNAEQKLKPGMFSKVNLFINKSQSKLSIPQTAVNHAPYGDSVYLVKKIEGDNPETGGKREFTGVVSQTIKLGEPIGDLVIVESGLKAGDEVVASGVFKLRPNAEVLIDNSILPEAVSNPNPNDT